MITKLKLIKRVAFLALLSITHFHPSTLFAQGTAFTYQGRLNDGANLANGTYDLRFTVFDNSASGNQQGSMLTNSATSVSNGLFTVTLDFGNQFPGASRWLEIAVRTNGNGSFFTLIPRQPLTPAPYAITAGSVVSGGINGNYGNTVSFNNANNNFSGTFSGNGANVANVNAATLGGLTASKFWQTSGNAGTTPSANYLGTTDNQPLELRVNGQRALRLEPTLTDSQNTNIVNVLNGSAANFIAPGVVGATIAGGGAGYYFGSGGLSNKVVLGFFGTIGGGGGNTISNAFFATVCGGQHNSALTNSATVGGGEGNIASGIDSTVPGGLANTAAGNESFAAGTSAKANHDGSFVWSDSSIGFSTTAPNQFLIRATGGVGIGLNNPAGQLHVASASGNPQVQITQNTTSDYMRLRMNVLGSPSWEMDVSPGATPAISWWTGTLKMNLDYNGNLTTVGTVNGSSDRNVKEHFAPVSARDVLEKVSSLPITEWNYITDGETLRHIGPMAQDFYAAFNVGTDDKHISMVDADGVALAAIQGLSQKLAEQDAALKNQSSEIQKLRQMIAELQEAVGKNANRDQE